MPSSSDSITPFSIPGNIKQQFLPFLLNPSAAVDNPQLFTYKNTGALNGGTACLGFYPATSCPEMDPDNPQLFNMSGLDKDLSFKLLYQNADGSTLPLTTDDIIASLPGISIREFLPDTRLDQCLDFFKTLFSKMSELITSAKNVSGKTDIDKQKSLMKKIWDCAKFTIAYLAGTSDKNFMTDAFGHENISSTSTAKFSNPDDKLLRYVHDFPFILYYRLQSCTTTNIYEVPAMCEGKPILWSDGKPGWGDGSDVMGAGGFRVSGLLNKIPFVGEIAEMVLGNIGINYMPWWNAESGAKVAAPEVNVKFDLFNDNVMKAMQNFIFVNTVVPSNRWVQYNMFQHSSNLYDVKIEGLNRLFACAASFDVTYEGVLRNPPEKFYKLLEGHVNQNFGGKAFIDNIKENNLIKIPDVYRVNMAFKSLLPANFNNFLYTYTQNMNHMTKMTQKTPGLSKNFGKGIAEYAKDLKTVFDFGYDMLGKAKVAQAAASATTSAVDAFAEMFRKKTKSTFQGDVSNADNLGNMA